MPPDHARLYADIASSLERMNVLRGQIHELALVTRELIIQSRASIEAADQQLRGGDFAKSRER